MRQFWDTFRTSYVSIAAQAKPSNLFNYLYNMRLCPFCSVGTAIAVPQDR